jgi:beta-glucosidase
MSQLAMDLQAKGVVQLGKLVREDITTTQEVQGDIHVSCKIKNTGKIKGDEVVQLYLRDEISSVTTYTKVLRGFERISLKAGEEQTVHFRLRPQDLGLWDKNMNFRVEPGSFKVMLGASSTDIRLHGQFEITP